MNDHSTNLLFSNTYINTDASFLKDTTPEDREGFIRYYRDKTKLQQKQKVLSKIQDNNEIAFENDDEIDRANIIQTEEKSIVTIDTKYRDVDQYPKQNSFKQFLGRSFNNVKTIRIVSSEIPNTDQVIREEPAEIRNNLISWQNKEDSMLGFRISVSLQENVPGFVDITVIAHNLKFSETLFVGLFNSTTTPTVDGEWYVTIIDADTLRFAFTSGIAAAGTANINLGIPMYTVALYPGNYSASTLATEIQKETNLTKRDNGVGQFHYFNVSVNLDTDVFTLQNIILTQLPSNPLATQNGTGIITVTQKGHSFKTGDNVTIVGAKNTAGISGTTLNGDVTIRMLDFNTFEYEVNEKAIDSVSGGGSTLQTGKASYFRLMFNTSNSLIAYNTGFPNEDSSEFIGVSNPLRTRTLDIESIELIGGKTRIHTTEEHSLEQSTVIQITSIDTGESPIIAVQSDHHLNLTRTIYISSFNTDPVLDGLYSVTSTGNRTFRLNDVFVSSGGLVDGLIKFGGDTVRIYNLKTIPMIPQNNTYFVENIPDNFSFDISFPATFVEQSTIPLSYIGTSQILVNHPSHDFNTITNITASSPTKALVTTFLPHNKRGKITENSSVDTFVSGTVDITVTNHQLETSDRIKISDSTCTPSINGSYYIQVVDPDTLRINFTGGVTAPGTATVFSGDTVIMTKTNATPSIDVDNTGNAEYFLNTVDSNNFEVVTNISVTADGTYGILGREHQVAIYRAESDILKGNALGGIPLLVINGFYRSIDKLIDSDNYMIRIPGNYATKSVVGGGSYVTVSSDRHGFRNKQSNTNTGDPTGTLFRSISLEGVNYIFLVSPGLKCVYAPGIESIGDVFAKVLLSEPSGTLIFNSYISAPKDFDPPIGRLNEIELIVKRPDGFLFNFNDTNYSISLEITELVSKLEGTFINSRSTSDTFANKKILPKKKKQDDESKQRAIKSGSQNIRTSAFAQVTKS